MLEPELNIEPRKPFYKKVFRFLFWAITSVIIITGVCIALVFIYEDEVKGMAIKELNKHLKTEVRIDPKNIDLTFISSFPKCAIEFKKLTVMEAWQKKQKDTLLFAESLSLRFNLKDLFNKKYIINQISLNDAKCFLKVDKKGNANYLVWETNESASKGTNDSLQFKLEDILVKKVRVIYKNKEQKSAVDFEINSLLFKGNFTETAYELTSKGNVYVNSFSADKTNYIKNKRLNFDVEFNVNENIYTIKKSDLTLNEMAFSVNGDFNYKDSLRNLKLDYTGKKLDIESVLSLLPDKFKSRINDYKSTGEFFANGNLSYALNHPFNISSKFGIKNATIQYIPKNTKLTNVMVTGELVLNGKQSNLNLSDINATLNSDNFSGNFLLNNFNDPFIDVTAQGVFNLQNVFSFWPIDTLEKLEGTLKFNGNIKGLVSDIKQNTFSDKLSLNVNLDINKLRTKFKKDPDEIAIESCKITAVGRDIRVENFKLIKGKSDIDLTGEIPGLFNYILDNKATLVIRGVLKSENFRMEDFIYNSTSKSETELEIPANFNLILDANINHFTWEKFEAANINGNFELKNQKAMVSNMQLETMEGEAVVDAFADASGKQLEITMQTQIKKLNVKKLFYQLNNFKQGSLMDKNINGIITATIDFAGNWDKKLNCNLNSIVSTAAFTIEKGELIEFKPLESLSKFVDLKELQRIKFSSLSSNLEIKNSLITIPQTTIKNSVLNIDFYGTHTFNNEIDYHIRLLISELLSKKRKSREEEFGPVENDPDNRRSAFILMTGTTDNPIIKYDKKGLKQKIKEDLKQEKKNIKQLLREEFGLFKKDSLSKKNVNKADQKFELEKSGNNPPKKTLEPKKKKDDDDDF